MLFLVSEALLEGNHRSLKKNQHLHLPGGILPQTPLHTEGTLSL